ncbi:MAG: hypothetical protein U5L09_11550 [Bacteroidales bacterium]|nr:hypothetical protein [Bacteroidales bacterium]
MQRNATPFNKVRAETMMLGHGCRRQASGCATIDSTALLPMSTNSECSNFTTIAVPDSGSQICGKERKLLPACYNKE